MYVGPAGRGVYQDHAHVFIACCRLLAVPARYVSGYVYSTNHEQVASHAWSEAWLGNRWVGLVADGRLTRFTVSIADRPGGLARLAEVIASTGASIKEIVHDRAFAGPDLSAVRVVCVVETTGHAHVEALHAALAQAGMHVVG